MKTSAVLASLLFGSFAVAAPLDKRAIAYHTAIVTETVVVYTTVYDDDVPAATATSAAVFYEKPQEATTSAVVEPTSAAAPASTPSAVVEEPSSVYTPSETPTPTPTPETQQPEEPTPTTTEQASAPAASSAAPSASAPPTSGGQQYTNVDVTIYDNNGGLGACGTKIYDTDMVVALAQGTWGASTFDVMTGASSNPWCGQKIKVELNGKSIEAKIMDLCPGCTGAQDIDLSLAAYTELTGLTEKTRIHGVSWSKID